MVIKISIFQWFEEPFRKGWRKRDLQLPSDMKNVGIDITVALEFSDSWGSGGTLGLRGTDPALETISSGLCSS